MNSQIEIDGKLLSPIKDALDGVSYSRDYVTRLAREGKIVASLIGRQWFVDCQSLKNYEEQSQLESELRKVQLSEERKAEQLFHKTKAEQESVVELSSSSVHGRASMMAGLVLCLGLATGILGQSFFPGQLDTISNQTGSIQSARLSAGNSISPDNTVFLEETKSAESVLFSTKEVTDLQSVQNGILILPSSGDVEPAQLFSDEVYIKTASSGAQSAVLVDAEGDESQRDVPFVIVPVKNENN